MPFVDPQLIIGKVNTACVVLLKSFFFKLDNTKEFSYRFRCFQVMDDEDDYFDTISVNSNRSNNNTKQKNNKRNHLTLSRHTIYHSIPTLEEGMEMTLLEEGDANHTSKKVANCKNREVKTYEQWRNRV